MRQPPSFYCLIHFYKRSETMSLDTYTQNIPLTQKARFWSNYVAALKGSQDLRAPDEAALRTWHPSIIETLPNDFPDLKHEFGKLESQMFDRPRRRGADPLSPVLPDARDRMFRNVLPPNVSTKVSNVPHTSFFVSLLMLSTGFTSMHSPRYDITVTHKD